METRNSVLVEAIESGISHMLAQIIEGGHTKQLKHPVGQHQQMLELETGRSGEKATR